MFYRHEIHNPKLKRIYRHYYKKDRQYGKKGWEDLGVNRRLTPRT